MLVMKNLKRFSAIVLFVGLGITVSAQRIAVEAGGALTGVQQTGVDFSLLTGFHVGPEMEFALSPKYGISTAALFEMRAGRSDVVDTATFTRILFYAQIPINLTYRHSLNANANLLFLAGPRINVGLFGTTNNHYYLDTRSQVDDSSPFGDGNAMKRVDIGFGIGVGLELKRFQFKLNYDFPITNSSNISDPATLKQHQLQLTVAYSIKKLK